MKFFLFFFSCVWCVPACAITTITASFFNANYNANNPLMVNETTIIVLDVDLPITISGAPIQVFAPFNLANDKIIFSGDGNTRIILSDSITWMFNFSLEFIDSAVLQAQPGAIFNFNGGSIVMKDQSKWLCVG